MNIRKYAFIALGVFVIIVFFAVGVSAEFNFETIKANPYQFIRDFFYQWSPALAAATTIGIAILAFLAIYDNRRSQRIALYNQYFSQVEEWAKNDRLLISAADVMVRTKAEPMSIDEWVKCIAQVGHTSTLVQSAVHMLGDPTLERNLDRYWQLASELRQANKLQNDKVITSLTDEMRVILDGVLDRVNYLRGEMLK
jgi:hypothetical protein